MPCSTLLRRHIPLTLLVTAFALSACAKDKEAFPSLATRDVERITGSFEPVRGQEFESAPPSAGTLDQLTRLRAEAVQAHAHFQRDADAARSPVAAARGAEDGTEAWAVAQVALARLEAARSKTMIALADMDRIYVAAQLEAAQLDTIEQVRNEVILMIDAEDRLINTLFAQLAN